MGLHAGYKVAKYVPIIDEAYRRAMARPGPRVWDSPRGNCTTICARAISKTRHYVTGWSGRDRRGRVEGEGRHKKREADMSRGIPASSASSSAGNRECSIPRHVRAGMYTDVTD